MFLIKSVDITGQQFGLLTAVRIQEKRNGHEYWLCQCSCNTSRTTVVRKNHLTTGRIRSCGCLYTGQKRGVGGPNTYVFVDDCVIGRDFKGNCFYLDRIDYDLVVPYQWYLNHDGYVVARINKKTVTMHRFLMGDNEDTIDHINAVKHDNRRFNLRGATSSENAANRSGSYVGKPVIGVYKHKNYDKYEALIIKNNERKPLGFYETYEEAVKARLQGEVIYFGEFAPQKHLFEQYEIKENLNV